MLKYSDPCEQTNRFILHVSEDRSTSCRDNSLRHCDSTLQQNWYRPMSGSTDVKMATSCVERDSCGTEAPIWLNGKKKLNFSLVAITNVMNIEIIVETKHCSIKFNLM